MGSNQDIIDSYLRRELNKDGKDSFEKSLLHDKSLKSDFELTKLISKSLSKRMDLYEQMSQWDAELEQKDSVNFFRRHINKIVIATSGLAASIIIGFIFLRPIYNSNISGSEDTYAYNLPYFDPSDYLSNDYRIYTANIDSLINIAEYEKAYSMICLIERDFENIKPSANNEFEKASLESPVDSTTEKYLNDAYALRWRKINTLLALGEKGKALLMLKDYKNENGKYKDIAGKLYDELSESKNNSK